jgi:DNA polymerase-1
MKLLVIDGNSILNRAFYGIKLLTTKDGLFTNGIYGFYNILSKLLDEVKPDAVAVAFDLRAPTFRHLQYEGYKAQRKGMPDELAVQMPLLKELLDNMGIKRIEIEGFEADDILGTQAVVCAQHGDECVIATGDKDSLQLISDKVTVLLAGTKGGKPETTIYNVAKIIEQYGIAPKQLIEVKALMGDSSDNIPGVAGIGEKTALDLIVKYGSVQNIYDNLETLDIKIGVKQKLETGKEQAFMSRHLAEIHTAVPIETDIQKLKRQPMNTTSLYRLLVRLEFFSIIEKMGLKATELIRDGESTHTATNLKLELAETYTEILSRIEQNGVANFCTVQNKSEIEAICFAFDNEIICALPDKTQEYNLLLQKVFRAANITKHTHNIKPVFGYCIKNGFSMQGKCFDTLLAAYILNPLASSYEPTRLCDEFGVNIPSIDAPFGLLEDVILCAKNAAIIQALSEIMARKIEQNGQTMLLDEVETPLAHVLASMEYMGFKVDSIGIEQYGKGLENRINEMRSEIFMLVGYEFNVSSTKQLGEALFVKLALPPKKKTKTGFSTDAEVLEALKGFHPVIDILLEFRHLSKLKSTYTDGLLRVVSQDGRIHTSFNQVETRTGRISSTEPNLQNIPVRRDVGRELRKFFIPAEGNVLIDADYSQIELRILAHISNDSAMIEAFTNHQDIHTITASQVFNMPIEMVTPLMRSRAKAVNFGIVYGISAFSLSQDIGVTVKEADKYIKGYFEKFSDVKRYMDAIIADAKQKGYVETLLGRRRMLPELASSNFSLRSFGERVALNTPIQGTAADIIKIAMVKVHNRLEKEGLKAKLILQVHDELIIEAPNEEAALAAVIVHEEMENAMLLKVKLEADVHTGNSWYTAKG